MNNVYLISISLALAASVLPACRAASAADGKAEHISVARHEPQAAAKAFPGNFTGNAAVTAFLRPSERVAASGALVAFEPGGRTTWHTHPAGQTLFVTSGTGWVQEWGGKTLEIKPGDVVWTPPGVKHWHGGTSTSAMTHVAIQGLVDGKNVTWMEPVSEQQYVE